MNDFAKPFCKLLIPLSGVANRLANYCSRGWTFQLHSNFIGDCIGTASTDFRVVEAEAHISDHLGQLELLAPEAVTSAAFWDTLDKHLAVCKQNGRCRFKVRARPRCTHSLHVELACKLVLKHTETELLKYGIKKIAKGTQYCGNKWESPQNTWSKQKPIQRQYLRMVESILKPILRYKIG